MINPDEFGPPERDLPDLPFDPLELLAEWFRWWRDSGEAPAKMPGGLHIKTVAVLAAQAVADGRRITGAHEL